MNSQEPLGLPRGSVRAIIAILVAIPLPVMVVLAMLGVGSISTEATAFYTAVLMLVLKDYFGMRQIDTATQLQQVEAEQDETSYAKDV